MVAALNHKSDAIQNLWANVMLIGKQLELALVFSSITRQWHTCDSHVVNKFYLHVCML